MQNDFLTCRTLDGCITVQIHIQIHECITVRLVLPCQGPEQAAA